MLQFDFNVTGSFKDGSGHPISIPKRKINYDKFRELLKGQLEITVILPEGERYVADVYHWRENEHSEYYQLLSRPRRRRLPESIGYDDSFFIILTRSHGKCYAVLERIGGA